MLHSSPADDPAVDPFVSPEPSETETVPLGARTAEPSAEADFLRTIEALFTDVDEARESGVMAAVELFSRLRNTSATSVV